MTIAPTRASQIVFVFAAMVLAMLCLAVPTPASAHGGPFELAITPDGAGGLVVTAVYVEDQHAVSAIIDPVASATSSDGTSIGPISLVSSSEGEGVWVTEEPFMPVGQWSVTVATTTPEAATATVEMTVEALDAPIEPAAPEAATSEAVSPLTAWLWVVAVALVLLVAGIWISHYRKRANASGA